MKNLFLLLVLFLTACQSQDVSIIDVEIVPTLAYYKAHWNEIPNDIIIFDEEIQQGTNIVWNGSSLFEVQPGLYEITLNVVMSEIPEGNVSFTLDLHEGEHVETGLIIWEDALVDGIMNGTWILHVEEPGYFVVINNSGVGGLYRLAIEKK